METNYVKRIGQVSLFVPIRTAAMLYRKKIMRLSTMFFTWLKIQKTVLFFVRYR